MPAGALKKGNPGRFPQAFRDAEPFRGGSPGRKKFAPIGEQTAKIPPKVLLYLNDGLFAV